MKQVAFFFLGTLSWFELDCKSRRNNLPHTAVCCTQAFAQKANRNTSVSKTLFLFPASPQHHCSAAAACPPKILGERGGLLLLRKLRLLIRREHNQVDRACIGRNHFSEEGGSTVHAGCLPWESTSLPFKKTKLAAILLSASEKRVLFLCLWSWRVIACMCYLYLAMSLPPDFSYFRECIREK